MQLKIEREALKKETDAASKDRLEEARKELAGSRRNRRADRRWQAEKQKLGLRRR
jgi:ATP-dependent Clp protease ATP-binding subunit ClpB